MTDFLFEGPSGPIAGSVVGDGPCLLLIAGMGATGRIWGDLPRVLSSSFTVVTMDNRGVGGSREGLPFTVDRAAEDVWAVLDHLGFTTAAFLGASLGGSIALKAAEKHPDRVDRMVIASSAVRLSTHGRKLISMLIDLLDHLPPKTFGRTLMTLGFAPPFHRRLPGFVDQAAELYGLDPKDVPGARAQAESMVNGTTPPPRLEDLHIPALVVAGHRDVLIAWEDTAEMAKALPDATFLAVPDGGHSILAEGGKSVFDRIVRFLRNQ